MSEATKTCRRCKKDVVPVRVGTHRLLCGDSSVLENVKRLFDARRATLVWTDPPYGVAYQTKMPKDEAAKRHRRVDGKEVANDALDLPALEKLIRSSLTNAATHCVPGAAAYAASPSGEPLPTAILAWKGSGFVFKHTLVWVKDRFVLGRADYHYRHETIIYGWKDDGGHYFVDDRTQDSVFEFQRPSHSEEHPTMKPIELVERMVSNSSKVGDLVYDPFSGSGTTLIACAKTGRRFVGCELDPGYADVIRRRWTQFAKSAGVEPGPGALEPSP